MVVCARRSGRFRRYVNVLFIYPELAHLERIGSVNGHHARNIAIEAVPLHTRRTLHPRISHSLRYESPTAAAGAEAAESG